jgi:FkbM family methyltransferase
VEFSEDIFKRRIAALLPAKTATRGFNGHGDGYSSSKQDQADLSGLWSIIDDEQFVQEAYRRILGREADVSGFVNYLELLRRHVPRRAVALQLVNSDEARRRGVRFVGIPGSVSAAGRRVAITPLRQFTGRVISQARELLRRPLYARFDSIDHKLNFILHDVTAKADGLSAKTDESLWTVSKKLDTYVADLQEYQMQIRRVLSQESAATTAALAQAAVTFDRTLSAIAQKLDVNSASLRQEMSAMRVLMEEDQRRIKRLEGVLHCTGQTSSPVVAGGNNVVAAEVDGFILGMPGEEWRMAAYHAFRGVMEPGTTRYFAGLVKPGMTVVDVGANIGIYTLYAARQLQGRGRIYSFEPTPRTFSILRDNVQVNGFQELGIVELRREAVSDVAGMAQLTVFSDDGGHNTLFGDGGTRIEVPTISLDDALSGVGRVDVVKIDAEGAEPQILRGMRQIIERSPGIRILMEFAPVHLRRAGADPNRFLEYIASLGFAVRRIHDETGALMETTREDLIAAFSANVELARWAPSSGGQA